MGGVGIEGGRIAPEYTSSSLEVFDVSFGKGESGVKCVGHTVTLTLETAVSRIRCNGVLQEKRVWEPGDVAFIPAQTRLDATVEQVGRGALFSIAPSVFVNAARDHIDHSLIDFRFAEITDATTTQLSTTLRHIAVTDGYTAWPLLMETTLLAVAVATVRKLSPKASVAFKELGNGVSVVRKKRLRDFIESNLHRQITLAELADVAAMSQFHFARQFKKAFGATPLAYLAQRRVEAAQKMLRGTSKSLVEVAADCGYASQSHMTTVFKTAIGTTPGRYRRGVTLSVAAWFPALNTVMMRPIAACAEIIQTCCCMLAAV